MTMCKECASFNDNPQKVWVDQKTKITAYAPEYFDSNGKSHSHDPNVETARYRCSNGHSWITRSRPGKCWCGWDAATEAKPAVGDPVGKIK